MRIGVIRGDLPGPIHLRDLETVSQFNPPTEPRGQEIYIGRPTTAEIEAALANATTGAGAVIQGSDISGSFPITLSGSNNVLKIRLSATASFTTVTVATGAKANIAALVSAVNTALATAGVAVTAFQGPGSGQRLALEANLKGVNSYVEIDTTGNGSTFDTPAGFTAGARTVPAASAFITALNPVSGSLNVSTSAINAVGSGTNANALSLIPTTRGTQTKIADAIAPQFAETSVAIDSFLVGMISEYNSSSFNPNSRGGAPSGAAISVVQDDGSTAFSAIAGLPTLSVADLNTPSTGALTLTGTFMGVFDKKETKVRVTGPGINKTLYQKAIEAAGGSVSATSIVIPASLIPGATLTTTTARVQCRQRVTAAVAMT